MIGITVSSEVYIDNKFLKWKLCLNQACKKLYLIDTCDMGFDDDQLSMFWNENYKPEDLADYFGIKYNLTTAQEVMLRD